MKKFGFTLSVVSMFGLLACSGSNTVTGPGPNPTQTPVVASTPSPTPVPTPTPAPNNVTIEFLANGLNPATVTVQAFSYVTFVNHDVTGTWHQAEPDLSDLTLACSETGTNPLRPGESSPLIMMWRHPGPCKYIDGQDRQNPLYRGTIVVVN